MKLKRKDGTPYDALLSMQPVEIGGRPLWHAIIQDISDRKEAEEALRQARQEWENIFQAIGQPTLILDKEHRLVHANSATERATGRPEKDLIGLKCYEIFHNSVEPAERCPFEKMLKTGQLETVEMEIEALNGTFLVSCTPMLDREGRLEKVIHIATDITEWKRAEAALRESERAYRELVENINDIIFRIDENGNFTYVSPLIGRWGYEPSDLIGRHFSEVVFREDLDLGSGRFEALMSNNVRPLEYRIMSKGGQTV